MSPAIARFKQHGAALLIFFLILFTTAAAVMLRAINNIDFSTRTAAAEQQAMISAKEALLAYAMSYADNYSGQPPGRLPCPDSNNDGVSDATCNNNVRGRLPDNITLPSGGLFRLNDHVPDIDRRLWYVVNTVYGPNPGGTLNSDTPSTLTLEGQDDVIAMIIAPGGVLPGQLRNNTTNRRNSVNYLEAGNVSGTAFNSGLPTNPTAFNDRVLPIYKYELMPLVTLRVAQHIRQALESYYEVESDYPLESATFATDLSPYTGGWYIAHNWDDIATFTVADDDSYVEFSFTGCEISYTITYTSLDISRNQSSCPD